MSLRLIFAGTPEFARVHLETLLKSDHSVVAVYTQPDRPAGRGQKLHASPVKALAQTNNLPIYQPVSLRDAQVQATLKNHPADLMVVVAYGLILPKAVLELFKHGCINVHASLLPRWRGAAPIQRAILAGDEHTGVTIMQMNEGLDTGDILWHAPIAITPSTTAASLHDELATLGAEALFEALKIIDNGQLQPRVQSESLATYAAKIRKEEGHLDWTMPAETLERTIRALQPWPLAHTYFKGERFAVWQARCEPQVKAEPFEIMRVSPEGIFVGTGDGVLVLETIQWSGGKPMAVVDWLRGHEGKMLAGDVLGE